MKIRGLGLVSTISITIILTGTKTYACCYWLTVAGGTIRAGQQPTRHRWICHC